MVSEVNLLFTIGFLLMIIGFILCFIGALLMILRGFRTTSSRVSTGGFIMIGPFPIVFGTSRDVLKYMLPFIIFFIIIFIVFTILPLLMR